MAALIYTGLLSLDGFLNDADGRFDWAEPDAEVHHFVNDLERSVGTYLYGRRLYEVMTYWETAGAGAHEPAVEREYARLWQAADKIVYSTTLTKVDTARTRLEPRFDPTEVRRLVDEADHDLSIGGGGLGTAALAAGLVDEVRMFLAPVVVGGGTPFLPSGARIDLELLDEHRFTGDVVYLRYRVRPTAQHQP